MFADEKETIEDWNDPVQTYFCLFCDNSFEDDQEILSHMIKEHLFDLKLISSSNQLSFYNQIKLVNYIRRQVYLKNCHICKSESFDSMEKLREHLMLNDHIKELPSNELWDQVIIFFI